MSKSIGIHSGENHSSVAAGNGVGLFLHAAAVCGPHGAILLMGHSSSGKTTLSTLLADHFHLISDDLVFVQPLKNGTWAVMNGSRIKTLAYENNCPVEALLQEGDERYPLHAIMRIFAAQQTELKPMPSIKTCEYLMDAVFEVDIQREKSDPDLICGWFRSTALMARQYPGRQLRFALVKALIVPLLQNKIE